MTEIPYGISKSRVIEQIADLVRDRKTEDIADLRDESDRDGMRIVIELKRGAKAGPVLNLLYKQTYLQATFGAIMLALDRGVPREMTLREFLEHYRDHRLEVIRRRAEYDLEQARAEAHITEGLLIALDNIDEVIELIRKAKDRQDAAARLRKRFDLSAEQADAILNMRLAQADRARDARAARPAQGAREGDRAAGEAARQRDGVSSPSSSRSSTRSSRSTATTRRTTILARGAEEFSIEDLVAEEDVVVTVTHQGYIKRIPMALYRRRARSGKALAGMERYEDDFLEHVFIASTHDTLLFFSADGQAYALPVHEVPEAGRSSRGRPLSQLLAVPRDAEIAAMTAVSEFTARARARLPDRRRHGQADLARPVREHPRRRDPRDQPPGGRPPPRRPALRRDQRHRPRHDEGPGDPLRRVRRLAHGPQRPRRARDPAPQGRRGRRHGRRSPRGHPLHRHRAGLRQAHPDRRVPDPAPRRDRAAAPCSRHAARPARSSAPRNSSRATSS